MPLPPLPANNTSRIFVDYAGPMGNRSMQFRILNSIGFEVALDLVEAFVADAVAPLWLDDVAVTGYRTQVANALITLPASRENVQGVATGSLAPQDYPRFIGINGRGSTSGRQVNLRIYGSYLALVGDYRFDVEAIPVIDNLLTGARALAAAGAFCAISGERAIIKDYVNQGMNAYYQRKNRRSL